MTPGRLITYTQVTRTPHSYLPTELATSKNLTDPPNAKPLKPLTDHKGNGSKRADALT